MDNPKTEETTHTDATEPIVSWSGVQGETQEETTETVEVLEEENDDDKANTVTERNTDS